MKRILTLALAAVMLLSLTACGGGKQKAESDGVPTLTWYVPGDKQADIASVMEKVNEITVPKIGAKLNLEFIDTNAFSEKMTMNMASGNDFDLCFTGWVNGYNNAVAKGGLMDLTELLKTTPDLVNSLPDYVWECAKIDGKIYAVPNFQTFALPMGLVIMKDVADKYDFDFSKVHSLDDLEPFLEMVKQGEPDKIPFRHNWGSEMYYYGKWEEVGSSGMAIRCDGSTSKLEVLTDTPEYRHYLEKTKEWFDKGYIREDVVGLGDDTVDYRSGKYVVSCEGWKPGVQSDVENDIGREVIVVKLTEPYMKMDGGIKTMIAIGANSKNPEKAMKFIELVNTDKELYNLIGFGIKDKHYTLDSDNKVTYIENGGYVPKMQWKFGNQFNALLLKGQEDGIWEETKEVNDTAVKSPLIGFSLNTDNIRNELSQVSAVSKRYTVWQYSEELWKERDQKLKEAGLDKIKEDVQRQVDEFLANKK